MEGLDGLPPWAQVIVSMVVLGSAVFAVVQGYTKKKIGSDNDSSKDAVVVSAAIADGQAIRDMTTALREHCSVMRDNTAVMTRLDDAFRDNSLEQRHGYDAMRELTRIMLSEARRP